MPKKPQDRVTIGRDQELTEVVFAARRRRMTRRDLHVALEPIVRLHDRRQRGDYHREVDIRTPADVAAIAKGVVRVLYDGFDYRGLQPIVARLVHEGRSETKATYESFTPEDVSKVFAGLGYRVEEPVADDGGEATAPAMIRCRKRGTKTVVQFWDRVEEENLYRRVRFEAEVELPEEERQRLMAAPDAPEGAEPHATVSVVHAFSGGVSLDWLIARIGEWEAVLKEHRRVVRSGRPRVSHPGVSAQTVH